MTDGIPDDDEIVVRYEMGKRRLCGVLRRDGRPPTWWRADWPEGLEPDAPEVLEAIERAMRATWSKMCEPRAPFTRWHMQRQYVAMRRDMRENPHRYRNSPHPRGLPLGGPMLSSDG